ncbi:MAG: hypothetical protein Kow0069_00170 [Promethearchaeota archaeon]
MLWLGKRKDGTSPLEYLILLILKERPRSGSEIISALNDFFGPLWEATTGTVYPVLGKMKAEKGLVSREAVKSPLGPAKKVYSLAPKGEALLDGVVRRDSVHELNVWRHYVELVGRVTDHSAYRDVLFSFLDWMTKGHVGAALNLPEGERGRLLDRLERLFRFYLEELAQAKDAKGDAQAAATGASAGERGSD